MISSELKRFLYKAYKVDGASYTGSRSTTDI